MENVLEDFEERVKEIDEYLKILKLLSQSGAEIKVGRKCTPVNSVALKTLKATCFLLLYNLVESTIVNSLSTLYETINGERRKLLEFKACIKDIWIEQQIKHLDPLSSNQSSYRNLIISMINQVIEETPTELYVKRLHISGNLDAKEIRKLFDKHEISTKMHYRAAGGAELKTIKDQRNSLAHGNISFAACGQEFTVSTIIDIRSQTVTYLKSALRNVSKHMEKSKYAA